MQYKETNLNYYIKVKLTEKEYVTTSNDKKLMDYDHYNINRPNHMEWNYK